MAKRAAKAKIKAPSRDELIEEALDYRRQSASYESIAATLCENHKQHKLKITTDSAKELVAAGLARIKREPLRDRLLLDIERCNAILLAKYQSAADGDGEAIDIVARFIDRRNKLEEKLSSLNADFFAAINSTRMGRPPHQPTDESIAVVQAMAHEGIDTERIAKYLGITHPTLEKHYADAIKDIRVKRQAISAGILWRGVLEGSAAHLFFYRKTQCGDRETVRNENQQLDANGVPTDPLPSNAGLIIPPIHVHFTPRPPEPPATEEGKP